MYYTPDNWVVIKYPNHYRILAGWSGGYTHGSSWRINSGVAEVVYEEPYYYFRGVSGSCYACHKSAYGLRPNNAYVWIQLKELQGDKVSIVDENTNWLEVDWLIGTNA